VDVKVDENLPRVSVIVTSRETVLLRTVELEFPRTHVLVIGDVTVTVTVVRDTVTEGEGRERDTVNRDSVGCSVSPADLSNVGVELCNLVGEQHSCVTVTEACAVNDWFLLFVMVGDRPCERDGSRVRPVPDLDKVTVPDVASVIVSDMDSKLVLVGEGGVTDIVAATDPVSVSVVEAENTMVADHVREFAASERD
jgi:hypothetical protein